MKPINNSNWSGLKISLRRFWEGEPIGREGTFKGLVLTVYRILEGEVVMRKRGKEVSAKGGDWIVCQPGERYQRFTESARLFAIHFQLESPDNAARWSGEPILVIGRHAEMDRGLNRMKRVKALRNLDPKMQLSPEEAPSSLDEYLELQQRATEFFRLVSRVIDPLGMRYEVSPIHDSRIRSSRNRLATGDLRQDFSREKLASELGLSASQLDRLWRSELGETPKHFWNQRRLETACRLLLANRLGKEVAYETGFKYLSQFSLWFRANMNESPRAYQLRHQIPGSVRIADSSHSDAHFY